VRIGLIVAPFISVPPPAYGGTELFVSNLAEALMRQGADVTVYANGESTVRANLRWLYPCHEWPLGSELAGETKEADHNSWAIRDASRTCDIIHINSALAVPLSRLTSKPIVCTVHHPYDDFLSGLYERHAEVNYVSISKHQAARYSSISMHVVHHGIDVTQYRFCEEKEPYLCFLGRICPIKGTHNAIEIAKRVGMPLKIAGEVQPIFRDYFEAKIKPHIDGKNIEFVGEANHALKNELLSRATALLFPIEWNEPFGLVMIESMACGTPVIAFPGGAVTEIVKNGVSGRICCNPDQAAKALRDSEFRPQSVRRWVEKNFSADTMAHKYYQFYSALSEIPTADTELDIEEAAA
jgi:glycosyltransferase involved in cell wall biosynthesis